MKVVARIKNIVTGREYIHIDRPNLLEHVADETECPITELEIMGFVWGLLLSTSRESPNAVGPDLAFIPQTALDKSRIETSAGIANEYGFINIETNHPVVEWYSSFTGRVDVDTSILSVDEDKRFCWYTSVAGASFCTELCDLNDLKTGDKSWA